MKSDVLEFQFFDRRGIEPGIVDPNRARAHPCSIMDGLEREHDWVLLIFSRSDTLQRAASAAAEILEERLLVDVDCGVSSEETVGMYRQLNVARACTGCEHDKNAVGYITWSKVCEMLAELNRD